MQQEARQVSGVYNISLLTYSCQAKTSKGLVSPRHKIETLIQIGKTKRRCPFSGQLKDPFQAISHLRLQWLSKLCSPALLESSSQSIVFTPRTKGTTFLQFLGKIAALECPPSPKNTHTRI